MNSIFRKGLALALSAATLLSTAQAAVSGTLLRSAETPLAENTTLTSSTYRDGSDLRSEHVLVRTRAEGLAPAVVYGDTLYGRSPMDEIDDYAEAKGFSAVAGINGSLFEMLTGIPMGMVITDGCVRSSGTLEAVGFKADGSAIIGYPGLAVGVTFPDGTTLKDIHCNKDLTASNGMGLFTRDYDYRTKSGIFAYNVILQPDQPDLKLNSAVTAKVTEIVPEALTCEIPEGGFVLAMAEDTDYAATLENTLKKLAVGDTVTFHITIGEGWGDVVSACAGMGLLVFHGEAQTSFVLPAVATSRTAVGLRENGDLVLCTVDEGGESTGLSLPKMAQRMVELGCVTALNLDGGGSTAIRVIYPGKTDSETINVPSDGKLRACANFLFLLREKAEAGPAARLFAYPVDACALPGGRVPMTVTATDEKFYPAPVPAALTYTAQGGTVDETGVFTAEAPGEAAVTVTDGTISGTAKILVVETPDKITVKAPATTVETGKTLAFTASATYAGAKLYAENTSFTWTCDAAIGAVDENGVFTAAKVYTDTKGVVTCAAGGKSAAVTVTVQADLPFADVENHWAVEPILAMYEAGVLKGSTVDGVPKFRPDDGMTRQEFLTALTRYLGVTAPEDTVLPFADNDAIAGWALEPIRAAYAAGYLSGTTREGVPYCDPASSITRQEAMVILSRTLTGEHADPALVDGFPDGSDAAGWARQGLADMLAAGVISGTSAGTLSPQKPVTRAQVAKMLTALPKNI